MIISPDRQEFTVNGRVTRLTRLQDTVLRLLVSKHGRVVSREFMMDHIYGNPDREPSIKVIDVIICNLRKKLREAGADVVIQNEWGKGYVLFFKTTVVTMPWGKN